ALLGRFPRHAFAEAAGPAGDPFLFGAFDRETVGLDIARDHRSRPDDSAVANSHRRHQRRVRADERAGADHRPIFAEPIIIAGDRAGADVRPRADRGIADVGQVIDLGALTDFGLFQFNEIADLGPFGEPRTRAD